MEKKWFRPASPVIPTALGCIFILAGLAIAGFAISGEITGNPIPIRFGGSKVSRGELIEDPGFIHYLPLAFLVLVLVGFGVPLLGSVFAGYETDEDGITSVDVFRRRKSVRWAEVTEISRLEHYLILMSETNQIKIYTGADWSQLRAELHGRLPDKVPLLS